MKPLSKSERNGAIAIALVALALTFGGFALKRCGTVQTADIPPSALIFSADTLNTNAEAGSESGSESDAEYSDYKKSRKGKHRSNKNDSTSHKRGKKGKSKSGKKKGKKKKSSEDNIHRRNHLSEPISSGER